MRLFAIVVLVSVLTDSLHAQNFPDTVNGWYFSSVRGGNLGATYSQILPGENAGVSQMFYYRTVTPGIQTYITWEKRYESSFVIPRFFVIRTRIPGSEPSMNYATAKLYFGDNDSTYGISPPGHGMILLTGGDSVWQDVRYSTDQLPIQIFNRIRLEFSFELPATLPSIAEYEFDSLTALYTNGTVVLIEGFGNPVVAAVPEIGTTAPTAYALNQNYPNPFNPSTTISFSLPKSSDVTVKIFDVLGREVATLVNEHKPAGSYTARWNAANVASGVYYYQLRAAEFTQTKKLLLLR